MPLDSQTPDHGEPQTLDRSHVQQVVKGMSRMLVLVAASAAVAVGIAVWLYARTIPQIQQLKTSVNALSAKNAGLAERNNQLAEELAENCVKLATRQRDSEKDFQGAVDTLNACMGYFPDDATLPAYKAEVLASSVAHGKPDGTALDGALEAAAQSIQIKPTTEAYDWQGLAYCLKAKSAKPADQPSLLNSAKQAFQAEFQAFPFRKGSLRNSSEFADDCPAALTAALYR
jgi:hypothetical protein